MTRFICIALLLIISSTMTAQNLAINSIPSLHLSPSDSLKFCSNSDCHKISLLKSAILPFSLITSGLIIESLPANTIFSKTKIQDHIKANMKGFNTPADNYLQFAPIVALYSFKLAGMKSKNNFLNQAILTTKSELLISAIVFSMKYVIHDTRPDNSNDHSMPSGHTAQAFASATLLDMEYRETSPWISVGGYLCAAATGFLRVANNHHWTSDMLIGAGIGIASVKVVYLTHQYRWKKKCIGVLVPTIYQNGGGVAFAMKF